MTEAVRQHEVWSGFRRGLGIALSVCAVFAAAYLIRGTAGVDPFPSLFSALLACLAGGAVGGVLFGLLHRWRSSVVGGVGAGAIVMFAVVMTLGMFYGTPDSWGSHDWKAVAMFTAIGAGIGAASIVWRRRAR